MNHFWVELVHEDTQNFAIIDMRGRSDVAVYVHVSLDTMERVHQESRQSGSIPFRSQLSESSDNTPFAFD